MDWQALGDMEVLCGFAGGVLAASFQPPEHPARTLVHLAASVSLAWLATPTAMRLAAEYAPVLDVRFVAGLLGLGAQSLGPALAGLIRTLCTDPGRVLDLLRRGGGGNP